MNSANRRCLLLLPLALLMLQLGACTTPKKPPKPPASSAASAPPAGSEQQGQGERAGGAPGAGQGYGPSSAHAAEVEIEEVATGGTPVVAADQGRQALLPGNRIVTTGTAKREQTSGGGGNVPNEAPSRTDRGISPTAGASPPAPPPAATDELVGPDVGEAAPAAPATKRSRGGDLSGRDDGRGTRIDDNMTARGAGGSGATATGIGNTPDVTGETRGAPRRWPQEPPAPGATAKHDDDVVARQLQVAIEREKDPVLQEKLRQEYRKYRAGH